MAYTKPDKQQLRAMLSELAYAVTQENKTERPFSSEYEKNPRQGIYVDVVSHEVLFATKDQFDSGCGWPSFTKPVTPMVEKIDYSHHMVRVEVRSPLADSHLGHVFPDGPQALGGLRYCINGAALRFIAKEDMVKEGFEAYLPLVES